MQIGLADRLQSIYPAIYYTTKTVQEGGRECLAVIIPGEIGGHETYSPPAPQRDTRAGFPSARANPEIR
jgi:hypothetical protein